MEWSLHPQLAKLTTVVGDLALSRVLLENDSSYPWLILVPRLPGISEIIDLDPNEQVQLLGEIDAASRALKSVAVFEKLNIAAIGNMVKQLHVHVIGRSSTDATWPKPVWGVAPPVPYEPIAREKLVGAIRRELNMNAAHKPSP
jgi:diadenosine tetraphosphate (Ap4A) HIT family hydrolase